MEQYYLLYTVMGKAKERLYFFSSQGNSEGKAYGQSGVWRRIEQILGSSCELPDRSSITRPLPFIYETEGQVSGAAAKWLKEN